MSKLQPTPQYVHTVFVRRMRAPHGRFGFGDLQDGAVAGLGFHALHDVDHAVETGFC